MARLIEDGPCPGKFHKIVREQNKKERSDEPSVTANCELHPETRPGRTHADDDNTDRGHITVSEPDIGKGKDKKKEVQQVNQ